MRFRTALTALTAAASLAAAAPAVAQAAPAPATPRPATIGLAVCINTRLDYPNPAMRHASALLVNYQERLDNKTLELHWQQTGDRTGSNVAYFNNVTTGARQRNPLVLGTKVSGDTTTAAKVGDRIQVQFLVKGDLCTTTFTVLR